MVCVGVNLLQPRIDVLGMPTNQMKLFVQWPEEFLQ